MEFFIIFSQLLCIICISYKEIILIILIDCQTIIQIQIKMQKYHSYQDQFRGKYSIIFKARRKKHLDFVALKRMDKVRKPKLINEAKILADIKHPNVIRFVEYLQTNNHIWAVTQYCAGGDLLKLIQQDKSFPQQMVRTFTIQIMKGLQFVHSKGVVMCDLKPALIYLNQYGNVKLGDFGAAQFLVDLMHSQHQKKKGTPCYMAPQLFEEGGVYSFQSDLWALGCIMFELSQGSPPFVSTSLLDMAQLAKTAQTPKVQYFSSDFNHLLDRLLAKNPANRCSWKEICQHPWIRGELPVNLQIPKQPHFQEYKKSQGKGTSQMLRVSQQFQGYGNQKKLANDRRQEFVFENDRNHEEEYGQDQVGEDDQDIKGKVNEQGFMKGKQYLLSKRPNQVSQIQDSTTINIFLETLSSKNMPATDQVIEHQSDNSVKPIIGNAEIEPIQSFSFNKKALGFSYIEPSVLADGILNGQMETQLKKILDGMTGDQKYNVLGYFQSIIQNSEIANYLFKSSFINFYMRLMKGYKQSALRAKICEILGLLIRHATAIDPQILKYGIINGFLQAIKDKNQKVRRKAMAALGQLLFYGATQVDEKINEWDVSMNLIHSLLKILKNPSQDEIVRIYCCKSIENITAQAKQVGLKFAQLDTLIVLIGCFNSTKNQSFKASISCCLHHIIHLNSTLRQVFLQKVGVSNLIDTFRNTETSNKTNQIILWVILTQFDRAPKSKITKSYLQDQILFQSALSLLQINSSVIKGRVFLYSYFVLANNLRKTTLLLDSKLFQIIERQGKDGAKYETQCLQFVLVVLYQNYNKCVKNAEEDIRKAAKGSNDISRKSNFLGVLSHIVSSPIFEELFWSYQNVQELMNLINLFDVKIESNLFETIKGQYMQAIQKILSNTSITQKLQQQYSSNLLPFLVGKILKSSQNDIKFCCMKYLLYLVSIYMSQESVYDSTILAGTTNKITSLINDHLIPQLDFLLKQEQTVASMTLKLIAVLFQINKTFVQRFYATCKIESILPFYHEHSSVNVLKIVQILAASHILSQADLKSLLPSAQKLLIYYTSTGQEIFLEYPLDILKELSSFCTQEQTDKIWEIVLSMQAHQDMVIREKSQNLIEAFILNKKTSNKGKWEIKEKKGMENYQNYLKLGGKESEIVVADNFKKGNSRYR